MLMQKITTAFKKIYILKVFRIATTVAMIIGILLIGVVAGRLFDIPKLRGDTVKIGLRNISNLNTAEYHYTHIQSYEDSRYLFQWKVPLTDTQAIYTYEGTVSAGVDFSKIEVDINSKTKIIKINLPKPTITNSEFDPSSLKTYYEKINPLNPMSLEDFNNTLENIKDTEEQNAIDSGLLNWADDNARRVVENFIAAAYGMEEYSIEFVTDSVEIPTPRTTVIPNPASASE